MGWFQPPGASGWIQDWLGFGNIGDFCFQHGQAAGPEHGAGRYCMPGWAFVGCIAFTGCCCGCCFCAICSGGKKDPKREKERKEREKKEKKEEEKRKKEEKEREKKWKKE